MACVGASTRTPVCVEKVKLRFIARTKSFELSGKVWASSRLKPVRIIEAPKTSAKQAAIFKKSPFRLGTQTARALARVFWGSFSSFERREGRGSERETKAVVVISASQGR